MSESFKPFFVDLDAQDAATMMQTPNPEAGRYFVIAVIGGVGTSSLYPEAGLVAYRVGQGGPKRLRMLPIGLVSFVGFVGDCIMCDRRKPEEGV